MRRVMEPRNVVAVCGTTGVGKSAFAVDLARSLRRGNTTTSNGQDVTASVLSDSTHSPTRAAVPTRRDGPTTTTGPRVPIRGVVLSADSMQLYEGLEVITNKVTEGEMRGVEHWGVGGVGRSPREASRKYRTGRGDGVDPVKETTLHDDRGSIHDDDGEIRMNGFSGVRVGEGSWEVGRWVTEAWRKVSHVFISLCGFCLSLPSLESRSTGVIDGIPRLAPFRPFRNACRLGVDGRRFKATMSMSAESCRAAHGRHLRFRCSTRGMAERVVGGRSRAVAGVLSEGCRDGRSVLER